MSGPEYLTPRKTPLPLEAAQNRNILVAAAHAEPQPKGAVLEWTLADYIAGRAVVADPNLAPLPVRQAAPQFAGSAPNNLRVVAAHAVAAVGGVIVVAGLRRPLADHLSGREAGSF